MQPRLLLPLPLPLIMMMKKKTVLSASAFHGGCDCLQWTSRLHTLGKDDSVWMLRGPFSKVALRPMLQLSWASPLLAHPCAQKMQVQ